MDQGIETYERTEWIRCGRKNTMDSRIRKIQGKTYYVPWWEIMKKMYL